MNKRTGNRTDKIETEWLVIRCQNGERAAAEALVLLWQSSLVSFATVVVGDREVAREAVQEAWIALFRGLPRLRDPATFRTWMFRIVNNKCIDALRAHKETREAGVEPIGRIYLDQLEDRDQILTVLAALSKAHRAVLALHYLHDMEVREIATMLQVPPGTVKSRLFNAREAFRQFFFQESVMAMLACATLAIVSIVGMAGIYILSWIQISQNATLRELKRLELQIALLAQELNTNREANQ